MTGRASHYDHVAWSHVPSPTFTDPEPAPLDGDPFYYLIGGLNACGDAPLSLGDDSMGVARPVPSPNVTITP
jgi:hypothetical protein